MNLEILTPEKKLFSGNVYGVQLTGVTGCAVAGRYWSV
jgi:F-type H+-transporting ATPase subunit epsilon